jgi:hypothetical protein
VGVKWTLWGLLDHRVRWNTVLNFVEESDRQREDMLVLGVSIQETQAGMCDAKSQGV